MFSLKRMYENLGIWVIAIICYRSRSQLSLFAKDSWRAEVRLKQLVPISWYGDYITIMPQTRILAPSWFNSCTIRVAVRQRRFLHQIQPRKLCKVATILHFLTSKSIKFPMNFVKCGKRGKKITFKTCILGIKCNQSRFLTCFVDGYLWLFLTPVAGV